MSIVYCRGKSSIVGMSAVGVLGKGSVAGVGDRPAEDKAFKRVLGTPPGGFRRNVVEVQQNTTFPGG